MFHRRRKGLNADLIPAAFFGYGFIPGWPRTAVFRSVAVILSDGGRMWNSIVETVL